MWRACHLAVAGLLGLWMPAYGQLAPAPVPAPQTQSPGQAAGAPLALAPAPPPVRGRYLDAVPTVLKAGEPSVSGRQITLAVDLAPKPSMRVYAPGNTGYSAVTLTIDEANGLLANPATKYPKPEDYLFAPLNERFKVYSSPFRLTREVTIPAGPGSGRPLGTAAGVVITGRLEYQACDDKVCYLPQSLPISWTIAR